MLGIPSLQSGVHHATNPLLKWLQLNGNRPAIRNGQGGIVAKNIVKGKGIGLAIDGITGAMEKFGVFIVNPKIDGHRTCIEFGAVAISIFLRQPGGSQCHPL